MTTAWGKVVQENRKEILQCWNAAALSLFSDKTTSPLIGDALSEGMAEILDGIDQIGEGLENGVNNITRILAIQPFAPSGAMSVFFSLKHIILETARKAPEHYSLDDEETIRFLTRIDEIILMAFDRYMMHREKLYQLKVEETRNRMYMALRRAGE
ncbi:MAG: hypothetical protein HGB36_08385 [Chlorobiaceae bacterium]|nr:hypothetical protein [Chlorobiaceae bacterium]